LRRAARAPAAGARACAGGPARASRRHRRHDLQPDRRTPVRRGAGPVDAGIERYAKPEFERFSNLASSELTLDQWLALAKRLNEILRTEPGIAGLAAPPDEIRRRPQAEQNRPLTFICVAARQEP